ncbi:ATP-binding protein [Arcobacter sp. YIC-464]|uniref:ATP-binding protein n=1 Tax=Arcobacter sp. YIC-464 TaxID=3376631 RepID=UPI003C274CBF
MPKIKSLKKSIFTIVIILSLFFSSVILSITIFSFFNFKYEYTQHSQKEILTSVKFQINDFLNKIEKLASYVKHNEVSLEYILNTNDEISTILILDSNKKVKKIYSKTDIHLVFLDKIENNTIKLTKNNWSDLIYFSFKKEPSIAYSFNIKNETFVFLISLKKISALTKNFKNSDSSSMIRLFDSNGKFIINDDLPKEKTIEFDASTNEYFTKLINIQKEFILTKFNNICLGSIDYGMYTTIEKTNWKLVLRENINLLESYIMKVVIPFCSIIFLFVVFMFFIINKYLKRVFIKLNRFKKQFRNISNGEYQTSVDYTDFHELNSFIKSFDKMRLEINKRENFLKQNLENFKKLVDSTMEGIIIHNKDKCLIVNESAVKILGYKDKLDLQNKKVFEIVPTKYKKLLNECFNKGLDIENAKEFKLLKKDNSSIYVLAKDQGITLENESLRISLFLDITNLKEQNRLIMEQSKLSSIAQMLTNIAHHWRQPLSTISVLSSGMKLEKELNVLKDEELLLGLDKINKTTKELSSIIDRCSRYFELSKSSENFDLIKSLNASFVFIEPILLKNEITLIQKHQEKEVFIEGYSNELSQVVFNLLDNSIDAIINSKVEDKYILIETKLHKNKVILKINDSGLGIKKTEIDKIFEPYFTTKEKKIGAGIGLYMAHYIITKHMKANIKVSNNTFTINNKRLYGLEVVMEFKTVKN